MTRYCKRSNAQTVLQIGGVAALFLLTACGGGGGSNSSNPDESPDPSDAICVGDSRPPANPVLYLSDGDGVPPTNLYLVDADNPQAGSVRVNGPLSAAQVIKEFALSPDNRCVVYISDEGTAGRFELYAVDLATPGISARLNPALSANQDVKSFVVSPDSGEVLYVADQDVHNRTELYLVKLNLPGTSVKVNPPLVAEGDVSSADIAYSPDGTQLLYAADQRTDGIFEIFLVNKAVTEVAVAVNGQFPGFVNLAKGLGFSPDGNWIGYLADQEIDDVRELFVVDVSSPGNSIKLNPPYTGDTDICSFEFRPDSQAVAYCADQDTEGKLELYAVSLDTPGISTRLNSTIVDGGEVRNSFRHSTDSDYIVYIADQDTDTVDELYRVELASPGVAVKINDALVNDGDVDLFEIRPDNQAIAYVADQEVDKVFELFQRNADSSTNTVEKLNPPRQGNNLFPFEYSFDSAHLIYIADERTAGRHQLYRIDVNDPGVSVRLNSLLIAGGQVSGFAIPQQ